MELDERYNALMSEIIKQEELIENYANKLEDAGNIDPTIEEYLQNTREELRQRKLKLIEEFTPKEKSLKNSSNIRISINEGDDSPKVKAKCNTPNAFKNRAEKFPFYSVHKIEVVKNPPKPTNIFKKDSSSTRGYSPSALRYSPHTSPLPEKIITKEVYKKKKSLGSQDSGNSSTECSMISFEKML